MQFILNIILNWVWGKASDLFAILFKKIKEYKESKDTKQKDEAQAEKVEQVRQKIISLINEGKPVPEELQNELRIETERLISGTYNSDIHN
jgi:cell shape-determining protein MreC